MTIVLDNGTVIKTYVKDGRFWMSWKNKDVGTVQVPVRVLEDKRQTVADKPRR